MREWNEMGMEMRHEKYDVDSISIIYGISDIDDELCCEKCVVYCCGA